MRSVRRRSAAWWQCCRSRSSHRLRDDAAGRRTRPPGDRADAGEPGHAQVSQPTPTSRCRAADSHASRHRGRRAAAQHIVEHPHRSADLRRCLRRAVQGLSQPLGEPRLLRDPRRGDRPACHHDLGVHERSARPGRATVRRRGRPATAPLHERDTAADRGVAAPAWVGIRGDARSCRSPTAPASRSTACRCTRWRFARDGPLAPDGRRSPPRDARPRLSSVTLLGAARVAPAPDALPTIFS